MKKVLFILLLFLPLFLFPQKRDIPVKTLPKSGLNDAGLFIENKGQWNSKVKFLSQINGMNAWITEEGIVYDFYKIEQNSKQLENFVKRHHKIKDFKSFEYEGHIVKMIFDGASKKDCEASGIKKKEGYHNYFHGNDKSKWAAHVPLYKEVRVEQIYNGINARYYYDGNMMRYDIEVLPGSEVEDIKIRFDGQENLSINQKGELEIKTSLGVVNHGKIFAYQEKGGEKAKIECAFLLNKNNSIGFDVKEYDKTKSLIIDPLIFSTFLGGDNLFSMTFPDDMIIHPNGNITIVGGLMLIAGSFPTTIGAYKTVLTDPFEAFITTLSPDASRLIFSTFWGGSADDDLHGCDRDLSGNIYITGVTNSPDLPSTAGSFCPVAPAGDNAYIAKLSSDGSSLIYCSYIGGSNTDEGYDIKVDASGNAYILGKTGSTDFPVTAGAFQRSYGGGINDCFISKFNQNASALIYSSYVGGIGNDDPYKMVIDAAGSLYATGVTTGNFPVTPGAFQTSFQGINDGFIFKINPQGSALVFSSYLGSPGDDAGYTIDIDASRYVYVGGITNSNSFPTSPGAYQRTLGGLFDAFITKLSEDGSSIIYSTLLGKGDVEDIYSIKVSESNSVNLKSNKNAKTDNTQIFSGPCIYVFGSTISNDFPVTPAAYQPVINDPTDYYITKLNSSGSDILYSTFFGGTQLEIPIEMQIKNNLIYFTGISMMSVDFPTTPGVIQPAQIGIVSATISELDITSPPNPVITNPVTAITSTGAILNGIVNPNGFLADIFFEYGKTMIYGNLNFANQSPILSAFQVPVDYTLSGLLPNTEYHIRLVANNGYGGNVYGNDVVFKTRTEIPLLIQPVNNGFNNGRNVQFKWMVYNGADSYNLLVSTDPNFTNIVVNSNTTFTVYETQLNLLQKYYWKVGASNSTGTSWSQVWSFSIPALSSYPEILDLGTTSLLNPEKTGMIILTNLWSNEITVSNITIIGDNSFALLNNQNINIKSSVKQNLILNAARKILPGKSDTLIIVFHPVTTGSKTAQLVIYSDDIMPERAITLIGVGGGKPVIQPLMAKIDFGLVKYECKKDTLVIIENNGNLNLNINFIIEPNRNCPFVFRNDSSRLIIPPGGKDTIKLSLFGILPFGDKYAQLLINSNDTSFQIIKIDLAGCLRSGSLAKPFFRVYFDSVRIGRYQDTVINIKNSGNDILNIFSFIVDGDFAKDFNVENIPNALAPGEEIKVKVRFHPKGIGLRYARIGFISDDPLEKETSVIFLGYGIQNDYIFCPILLSPENNSTKQAININLIWVKVNAAYKYRIQLCTDTNFTYNVIDSESTDTIIFVKNLKNNYKYYWRIKAISAGKESEWSSYWSFTTVNTPPLTFKVISPIPNGIVNSNDMNKQYTFKWNKSVDRDEGDIVKYSLVFQGESYYKAYPDLIDTSITISFNDLKLRNEYKWYIISYDGKDTTSSEIYNFKVLSSASEVLDNKKPKTYELYQNYPNPFNASTVISYQIPEMSYVSLKIFDVMGREVTVLVSRVHQPGIYEARWNATDIPSGIYYYYLSAGVFNDMKKLILLK